VADVIADWKSTPGAVGIRIMLTKEANRERTTRVSTGSYAMPFAVRFHHPSAGFGFFLSASADEAIDASHAEPSAAAAAAGPTQSAHVRHRAEWTDSSFFTLPITACPPSLM
jgi:hypothetical protein